MLPTCTPGSSLSRSHFQKNVLIQSQFLTNSQVLVAPLLPRCSETSEQWVRNRGRGQRSDTGACSWRRCKMPSTFLHRTSSCRRTTDDCEKVSVPRPDALRLNAMGIPRDDSCAAKTALVLCSPGGYKGCSQCKRSKDPTVS